MSSAGWRPFCSASGLGLCLLLCQLAPLCWHFIISVMHLLDFDQKYVIKMPLNRSWCFFRNDFYSVYTPNPCFKATKCIQWVPEIIYSSSLITLQWRHNGCDVVSDHQPHHCLLNRSFRRRSKKTSKLRVTGLCAGNSPVTGEFPAQRSSNAENVPIWWRHHDYTHWCLVVHLCISERHLHWFL